MSGGRARRILIDGSMARSGGGFTYLANVIPRLVAAHPEDRFRLLLRSERLALSISPAPNLEVDLLPAAGWGARVRFTMFAAARLARAWGADLYFSAGESAPPRAKCPVIASFRNPNIFTACDQGWPWRQRSRLAGLRGLARVSAATCARILFVSEDSARWIGDSLRLPWDRRAVVHHGVDAERWANLRQRVRPPLQPSSYILSVSSIYRYKNYIRLIEAYARLASRRANTPDLVIVGDDQDPAYSQRMEEARRATGALARRIHILGEVPYDRIRAYYAGAELFVFPSYLETFGHPLVEAMAAEVPVVAADTAVFREIGGDAALYAPPHDADALARAMEEVLTRQAAREVLTKRGLERARGFSWERSAKRLALLFDEVIQQARDTRRVAAWTRIPA